MLRRLLSQPDAFEGHPLAFTANQAGHVALGAALMWALGPVILSVLYLAWEAIQYLRFRGALWDGVEDAAFVVTGAVALTAPWVLLPTVLHILAGAIRRS